MQWVKALAVVCRHGDDHIKEMMAALEHSTTALACLAERGLLRELQGGCKVPIAVRTETEKLPGNANGIASLRITIHGSVISSDGKQCVESVHSAVVQIQPYSDARVAADELGVLLGRQLKARGADRILSALKLQAASSDTSASPSTSAV